MISKRYFIKKAQDQAPVGVEDSGSNNTSEQGASVSVVENDPELNAASNENNVKHNELIIFEQGKAINKGMSLPPGKYWVIRKLNPDISRLRYNCGHNSRGIHLAAMKQERSAFYGVKPGYFDLMKIPLNVMIRPCPYGSK